MFQLGIITDEVSQDFEFALQFAKKHNLDCVELRSAWEKNPFSFTESDVLKIKTLIDKYQMPIVAISSPFYKCDYFDAQAKKTHIAGLERVLEYAKILNVPYIRCFDFFRDARVTREMIREAYAVPIQLCRKADRMLLIESEPTTNAYDCKTVAALVECIDSPFVQAIYEPGNNIYSPTQEIPYPDGFQYLSKIFKHVHVKDAVRQNGKAVGVAIGSGLVDYAGIVKALLQMDFTGAVVLETHYRPGKTMDEAVLKNPSGSKISEGGEEASEICILALKNIIKKAKAGGVVICKKRKM